MKLKKLFVIIVTRDNRRLTLALIKNASFLKKSLHRTIAIYATCIQTNRHRTFTTAKSVKYAEYVASGINLVIFFTAINAVAVFITSLKKHTSVYRMPFEMTVVYAWIIYFCLENLPLFYPVDT